LHPASTGVPTGHLAAEVAFGHGPAGLAAQTGQPQRLEEAPSQPDLAVSLNGPTRSQLAVPLLAGERVSGVLVLESSRPAAFGAEDERLMTIVARQLANALRSASLYADVQARMAELRQAQDQLVQSEKFAAIGRLTASIAHEVNNPLQSIHNCLRLAAEARLTSERRGEYLAMAEAELLRLMDIVRRMLEFYRPAAAERLPASVDALLEDVLALAGKQLRDAGVVLHRGGAGQLPPVRVVANHMRQVFLNLILNAVEAMPQGGTLEIDTSADASAVSVRFKDSGNGLDPAALPQIFEPFYTTKAQGTGLGLSISYGIVAAHGGRIDVESQPGHGAAFTVHLPVGDS
jgi:two-component system NtrC family sensor kinase